VLFTSFLKTLAPVNRALFARLAPDERERVEFATVHAVALRWLREHGTDPHIDQSAADTCFARAWGSVRHESVLAELTASPDYWREEIRTVIKGRGLAGMEEYALLARVGRRTPLLPVHRAAVWALYERYQELLRERGVGDVDDLLLAARDLARRAASTRSDNWFDAVIVDEVQDLTCTGLQFLHALVGDRTDGLLLVGDGQQSVYPGGFTLAEAGVSVVGRSTVLNRNYRNGELILRYALTVVADDQFDDLEADPAMGLRNIEAGRPGGEVLEVVGDQRSQELAMTAHMEELRCDRDVRYGDMAVLVPSNKAAEHWQRALARHDVPAILLKDYAGVPCEAVKVGTFHRAKGLEFARVFIPDRDRFPEPQRPREPDDVYRERAERERRLLFVALTRARDGLCLGSEGPSA
jgi:superfamily I DNA/RNA helicase